MKRLTTADLGSLPANIRSQLTAFPFPANRRPKALHPTESQSQQAIIKWWAVECLKHALPEKCLKAFPLQGARTARNGARMKCEGMRAGTLDMFLGVARASHHGLWIELKTPIGKLSPAQKEMLKLEHEQGYCTVVARSADEARHVILAYLALVAV